jgi:hypothetical protein
MERPHPTHFAPLRSAFGVIHIRPLRGLSWVEAGIVEVVIVVVQYRIDVGCGYWLRRSGRLHLFGCMLFAMIVSYLPGWNPTDTKRGDGTPRQRYKLAPAGDTIERNERQASRLKIL